MTKAQRVAHKKGNQARKRLIMLQQKHCMPGEAYYWATFGLIQNGKWS